MYLYNHGNQQNKLDGNIYTDSVDEIKTEEIELIVKLKEMVKERDEFIEELKQMLSEQKDFTNKILNEFKEYMTKQEALNDL